MKRPEDREKSGKKTRKLRRGRKQSKGDIAPRMVRERYEFKKADVILSTSIFSLNLSAFEDD